MTAIAFLISIYLTKAQDTQRIKHHPIIEKVLQSKNVHITVEHFSDTPLFKTELYQQDKLEKRLVRTPEKLYALLNGAGRVYEITNPTGNNLKLTRLDNTIYWGYNFGHIQFEYKGKLYSFGGNGFWRRNGQLRVFSEIKKEWDIVPINEEIPVIDQLFNFDYNTGKLYYFTKSHIDYTTNKKVISESCYCLDLNNFTNTKLGTLSTELQKIIPEDALSAHFLSYPLPEFSGAIFTDLESNHKFVHFPSLKVYNINNDTLIQALKGTSKGYNEGLFSIDSILYVKRPNESHLDSINIKYSFFDEASGKSILKPSIIASSNTSILIITSFLALLSILYFLYKKKTKQNYKLENQQNNISFDHIENDLIQLLKANLENGVTIPEVNDLLGLSKKPISIQKKNRNEVILNINNKYKIMQDSEEDLIIRKRDENDKRSFIYFLNQEVEVKG